jgi:histone H3/H4
MAGPGEQKLLWNQESIKDVAESVGIAQLNDEALRSLSQDVEYRLGQVIVEALRFMRAANRTTLTVQDVSQALKVLDVEPLYGYDSTRPLRYGEASLGPGQPLYYIEDEEVDFEKLINAPLPKVPRDMSFTGMMMSRVIVLSRSERLLTWSSSTLACDRRRPTGDTSEPNYSRDIIEGASAQGSWRKPCTRRISRQRQCLLPPIC